MMLVLFISIRFLLIAHNIILRRSKFSSPFSLGVAPPFHVLSQQILMFTTPRFLHFLDPHQPFATYLILCSASHPPPPIIFYCYSVVPQGSLGPDAGPCASWLSRYMRSVLLVTFSSAVWHLVLTLLAII